MNIGINAALLGSAAGGVETYVRNLIRALALIDAGHDYTLFLKSPLAPGTLPGAERMRQVVVQQGEGRLRLPLAFSRAVASTHVDVMHEQATAPFLFGAPLVVTIHDLYHEHFPQEFSARQLLKSRAIVALTARRAAAIVADSEFSKRDIVRCCRVPPAKVVVAHLAPDPMFQPLHDPARLAAVRARYDTGERFMLYAGTLKPNKNLPRLVEAFVRLRRAGRTQHRLVLAGPKVSWLHDDLAAPARAAGLAGELIFTGRIPDDDLVALYNAAEVFVHPSLFEGFGLPPLEAMACGTPVITSPTASTPEVVGDAAVLVDPLDVEAIAGAMATVLDDPALRARLSEQGRERAATFSWEHTARTVLGVYQSVAGHTHR